MFHRTSNTIIIGWVCLSGLGYLATKAVHFTVTRYPSVHQLGSGFRDHRASQLSATSELLAVKYQHIYIYPQMCIQVINPHHEIP